MTEYQQRAPLVDQIEITITAPREQEEPLTMLLLDNGADGVEVRDNALIQAHLDAHDWDASVYDGQTLSCERVLLRTMLPLSEANKEACAAIRAAVAELDGVEFTAEIRPPEDWQEKWKEGFRAHAVGERLWLRPFWDETPAPDGRVEVVVDPGLAFGTGEHATTEMVLTAMEDRVQPGDRVIDFGCGSGILGMAGLKLGAAEAVGVDVDDVCAEAVARHREINGLTEQQFTYQTGDILTDYKLQLKMRHRKGQVVVANITADVLYDLSWMIGRYVAPGGCFICSGILQEYAGAIAQAIVDAQFSIISQREQGEWVCFVAVPAYE